MDGVKTGLIIFAVVAAFVTISASLYDDNHWFAVGFVVCLTVMILLRPMNVTRLPLPMHIRLATALWVSVPFCAQAAYERIADFRRATGAHVALLHRGGVSWTDPARDRLILPGDALLLTGSARARRCAAARATCSHSTPEARPS